MITEYDVKRIAMLSKLEIKDAEMPDCIKEMEEMLCFARSVENTMKDKASEPQPVDYTNLRADEALPSAENSQILLNAKEKENGFFVLRKKA